MTPEERALQLDRWIIGHLGARDSYTSYPEILECLRAALRERDQQWRKALDLSHYDHIDGLHFDYDSPVDGKHYGCDECAPLRALLEEAGK